MHTKNYRFFRHVFQLLLGCLLCLSGVALAAHANEIAGDIWEPLLGDDYRQLWRGYKLETWPKGWTVEDGVLSRTEGGDDLITVETYGDFVLELEWKVSPGGNSGIMFRVSTGDEAAYHSGPEASSVGRQRV